ncbi:Tn3 family transposase [Streptomyces sp. NPDC018036]|uniref:Tn3 family transposase n=1 Tax=Streptomyces sp. NPDC018036 TaxID=3365035 RepID=UPI0037BCBBAC
MEHPRRLDAVVTRLRAEGHEIRGEEVARLAPLKDRHINFLGRYLFQYQGRRPRPGPAPAAGPDAVDDGQ